MTLPMIGGKLKLRNIDTGLVPGVGTFGQQVVISRKSLNLNTFIPLKLIVSITSSLIVTGTAVNVYIYYDESLTNYISFTLTYNTVGIYDIPLTDYATNEIYAIGLEGKVPDLTVTLKVYLVYIGG